MIARRSPWQGKYDPARMFYGRHVVAPLARAADAVMTVSHATAADVARYFHVPAERIEVAWNGIDHAAFRPLPFEDARRWAAEKGGQSAPFFLYLARLEHPAKNHVRLIEAFERFAAANPAREECLVFGGADWHGADVIHERVRVSPLRGRIQQPGFRGEGGFAVVVQRGHGDDLSVVVRGVRFAAGGGDGVRHAGHFFHAGFVGRGRRRGGAAVDPESVGDMAKAMGEVSFEDRAEWSRKGVAHAARFRWEYTARAVVESYRRAGRQVCRAGVPVAA